MLLAWEMEVCGPRPISKHKVGSQSNLYLKPAGCISTIFWCRYVDYVEAGGRLLTGSCLVFHWTRGFNLAEWLSSRILWAGLALGVLGSLVG